jgi:hypothetical protein
MSTLNVDRTQSRHYGDERGRYWSVSQVIQVITGDDGSRYIAGAAERGQDVHLIFALAVGHAIGKCAAPDVPTHYAGYYEAIQKWILGTQPHPLALEEPTKHSTLPYAGTPDFVGLLGDVYGVLDLKTGKPERSHAIQVCAYQKMLDRAAKQWVLYIDADGHFKQVTVKPSARDWAVFQNGLAILQWRESQ